MTYSVGFSIHLPAQPIAAVKVRDRSASVTAQVQDRTAQVRDRSTSVTAQVQDRTAQVRDRSTSVISGITTNRSTSVTSGLTSPNSQIENDPSVIDQRRRIYDLYLSTMLKPVPLRPAELDLSATDEAIRGEEAAQKSKEEMAQQRAEEEKQEQQERLRQQEVAAKWREEIAKRRQEVVAHQSQAVAKQPETGDVFELDDL